MVPVSETLVSVRVGRAWMRRCHCWGSGSQRAKSASVREKGDFSSSSLKLRRAAGGSIGGEGGGAAAVFLAVGSAAVGAWGGGDAFGVTFAMRRGGRRT